MPDLIALKADWHNQQMGLPELSEKYGMRRRDIRKIAQAHGWGRKQTASNRHGRTLGIQGCTSACPGWLICTGHYGRQPVECETMWPDDDPALYEN